MVNPAPCSYLVAYFFWLKDFQWYLKLLHIQHFHSFLGDARQIIASRISGNPAGILPRFPLLHGAAVSIPSCTHRDGHIPLPFADIWNE